MCGLKPDVGSTIASGSQSHPSWVCGLKQRKLAHKDKTKTVTPFVGVWIETLKEWLAIVAQLSHPSWVCGLKPVCVKTEYVDGESHPSWVCGLKPITRQCLCKLECHTLRGCVD